MNQREDKHTEEEDILDWVCGLPQSFHIFLGCSRILPRNRLLEGVAAAPAVAPLGLPLRRAGSTRS